MFVFDTRVFGALFVRVDIVMISRGGKGWWNQCEFTATLFFLWCLVGLMKQFASVSESGTLRGTANGFGSTFGDETPGKIAV